MLYLVPTVDVSTYWKAWNYFNFCLFLDCSCWLIRNRYKLKTPYKWTEKRACKRICLDLKQRRLTGWKKCLCGLFFTKNSVLLLFYYNVVCLLKSLDDWMVHKECSVVDYSLQMRDSQCSGYSLCLPVWKKDKNSVYLWL